jgi:hypothetical protein
MDELVTLTRDVDAKDPIKRRKQQNFLMNLHRAKVELSRSLLERGQSYDWTEADELVVEIGTASTRGSDEDLLPLTFKVRGQFPIDDDNEVELRISEGARIIYGRNRNARLGDIGRQFVSLALKRGIFEPRRGGAMPQFELLSNAIPTIAAALTQKGTQWIVTGRAALWRRSMRASSHSRSSMAA